MTCIIEKALEQSVTTGENTCLINALIHAIAVGTNEVVCVETLYGMDYDAVDGFDFGPEIDMSNMSLSMHALHEGIVSQLQRALVNLGYDNTKVTVKIGKGNPVDGYRQTAEKAGYYGLFIKLETPLTTLLGLQIDMPVCEDSRFIPVSVDAMPRVEQVSADEPAVLLSMAQMQVLVGQDDITIDALESVSMTALAMGWGDTESYGKMLLLIA